MIETSMCLNCQEEFEYRPDQSTIEDFEDWDINARFGLDAPALCEYCEVDDEDDMR